MNLLPKKKKVRKHNPSQDNMGFDLLDEEGMKLYPSVFEEKWFWFGISWNKFLWWR